MNTNFTKLRCSADSNIELGMARNSWTCALMLDGSRQIVSGSVERLAGAIRRGADLRIGTQFRHNEHIDIKSKNAELIEEVADFRLTYLLDDRWTAGIMTLRQPINLPVGFGARPSMSFFLYNQDGSQAIARPYMDGARLTGERGSSPVDDHSEMPKYHQFDAWDIETNAPSSNFIYDFESFKFWVCDEWTEVFAHDTEGKVVCGSIDTLAGEFLKGRDVKVGITGLCADLAEVGPAMPHEAFIQCGPGYYYTQQKLFSAGSQPVVRTVPSTPMGYRSEGWDFGWLMPRTDGHMALRLFDPYTLRSRDIAGRYAIRWFVR